jgi:FMN phosphatase YigB (HAD superfamily)
MTGVSPLIEVSEFVARHARNSRVAVIFDLDSTLFCVSPRTQAILRSLAEQPPFRAAFRDASEVLRNVQVLPTDWGVKAALERARLQPSVELIEEIRNYWRQHFFANHYLDHDTIYPSANEYVRHLQQMGAHILYLTGRHQGGMFDGTKRMLQHWGFPYFSDSSLIMKPTDVQTDESFKAKVLSDLRSQYEHIWFFENEPVIIDQVRQMLPQVHIVFVDSVHSGKGIAPTDLPTIGMSYVDGLKK